MATAERRSARVYRNCISRAAMIPSKLANRPSAGVLRRGGPTRIPASCSTRMLRREKSAHPPYNDMQPAHLPMQSGSNAEIAIATIRGVISRRESAQVRTGCRRERDRMAEPLLPLPLCWSYFPRRDPVADTNRHAGIVPNTCVNENSHRMYRARYLKPRACHRANSELTSIQAIQSGFRSEPERLLALRFCSRD